MPAGIWPTFPIMPPWYPGRLEARGPIKRLGEDPWGAGRFHDTIDELSTWFEPAEEGGGGGKVCGAWYSPPMALISWRMTSFWCSVSGKRVKRGEVARTESMHSNNVMQVHDAATATLTQANRFPCCNPLYSKT